jgi:hypothetical protein
MPMICPSAKPLFLIHLLLRSGQTLHQIKETSGEQVIILAHRIAESNRHWPPTAPRQCAGF